MIKSKCNFEDFMDNLSIKDFFSFITEKLLNICSEYRLGAKSMNKSVKTDNTLLTDADIELQTYIVNAIRNFDKQSYIIAEETGELNNPPLNTGKSVWIIDPIDGTAQFANPEAREYCIAICNYQNGTPDASLIIMPQLGFNRTPIIAEAYCAKKEIYINGNIYDYTKRTLNKQVSCTRSKGLPPHPFENCLINTGYTLKTSTTSQSIDLLRTACSLQDYSDLPLFKFDMFYRKKQKIWDGAPGFCFNYITGNDIIDAEGKDLLPLKILQTDEYAPVNDEIYVGTADLINKIQKR